LTVLLEIMYFRTFRPKNYYFLASLSKLDHIETQKIRYTSFRAFFTCWNREHMWSNLEYPLLRSEIPSGMCAKLRTVAACNNRDHPTRSLSSLPFASTINCSPGPQALLKVTHQDHSIGIILLLLVCATYIYFCSSHTSRSWRIIQSTQHHRRGCNTINQRWALDWTWIGLDPHYDEFCWFWVGSGVKRNFWLAKFLTSHHVQSNLLHTKYADKTDY